MTPLVVLLVTLAGAPQLTAAEKLLAEARFEDVARTLAPLLADETVPLPTRAAASVLLGVACHNLLDVPGARAAFAAALKLDRSVQLPAHLSPRTVALFAEVKQSMPSVEPPVVEAVPPPTPRAWAPTRIASLLSAGLTVVAGAVGTGLVVAGVQGRQQAIAEPIGTVADARFQAASQGYGWGTGLLFTAATTLALSVVLWLLPWGAP